MTREEAIKTIQELMIACTPDSKYYRVGQMAIQALSQEPCDDAISRKKAIYAISARDGKSAQIEALEQLPSVTQKSGKWENLYRCWMCSECGKQSHIEHKYCPNCGAKMESEE